MDTDVLIVGAGPTGLMLANQLARRGVRVMIVDAHEGPAQQTRAMGVQARTLEIYDRLGIAEEAIGAGAITRAVNFWAEARHTARVPIGEAGRTQSPFPYVLMLGQDDNERYLGAKLAGWGVRVQWNTELLGLAQAPDHVVATLKGADGTTREIRAAWVGGCDGSRSTVRSLNGIAFPGAPYEHVFFVADTVATGDMTRDELNVYLWRKGFHLFFPMRGQDRWRVIGILPAELRERRDLRFEDVVPHIRQEAGTDLAFHECRWFSTYRIQHRHADRFRAGRCFLLGDAAHIHSPMGAQGMNTGLQDAYNLAWKLAMVIRGEAGELLLDSYEAERLPVARTLLRGTDRAFGLVVADTRLAAFFRTRVMANVVRVAMKVPAMQRRMFRLISQTGIRYRRSPLSQGTAEGNAPAAGDRFPWLPVDALQGSQSVPLWRALNDLRFHLVVMGQPAPDRDLVRGLDVITVPDTAENRKVLADAGLAGPRFHLVRPDGHIALTGTRCEPDRIARYFAERQIRMSAQDTRAAPDAGLLATG